MITSSGRTSATAQSSIDTGACRKRHPGSGSACGSAAADALPGEAIAAPGAPPPRDPTDHRADNDVGGRVDVSKGWVPNIPDPAQSQSRFDSLTSQQGAAAAPESQPGS